MSVRSLVRGLVRQPQGGSVAIGLEQLERDWTFRPSRPDIMTRMERLAMRRRLVPPPPSRTITPVRSRPRWALYFIYAPSGGLLASHRYTLERLRSGGDAVMVVYASPAVEDVPGELVAATDALYWKGLAGYDFSAYAIGLDALARHSPGADILVMNDSVYGPFAGMDAIWSSMRWALTGFTATGSIQNHIQSYAFLLRGWDRGKFAALTDILRLDDAYPSHREVVFQQEARFAEQAARAMSVGALWYVDYETCGDPTIFAATALLPAGAPFLKKSLFTKWAHLVDQDEVGAVLRATGHPPPD